MKIHWLPIIVILSSAVMSAANAAWQTTTAGERAVAAVNGEHDQRLELFVDATDTIFLRLTLGPGFETFAATSCPTFQIDERTPMHHFDPGPDCTMADKDVTFSLGEIVDRGIHSLIVHRLLNGNAVTFRYTVSNGQYREAKFSLSRSKQATRKLLGYSLNVEADQPEQ